MMDRKTLIAIALSFLILVVWQLFFVKTPPKPVHPAGQPTPEAKVEEPATKPSIPPVKEDLAVIPKETVAVPAEAIGGRDITVETPLYRAVITTAGGRIASFSLLQYKETIADDSPPVDLVSRDIKRLSPEVTFDTPIGSFSDEVVYGADEGDKISLDGTNPRKLVLSWVGKQFKVVKTYTFDPKSYGVGIEVAVTNLSDEAVTGDMSVSLFDRLDTSAKKSRSIFSMFGRYTYPANYLVFVDNSLKKGAASKVTADKETSIPGTVTWFGFDNKYFLTALITKSLKGSTMEMKRPDENTVSGVFRMGDVSFPSKEALRKEAILYLGPKQAAPMDQVGYSLASAIDYGFFAFLSIPLVWLLTFFYSVVKNYGVAIIILTVVLRIVLYPFTHKSMKSMKEMQKLQPLILELREKYKNDREKMNQEVMRLYQSHKINPLGGCLPLLLQLPVFIALYKALYVAIELRHSPFVFWIKDLSEMDPYYITPIIMGASYFAQQKLTPTSMDPTQQKIMLLMPVIFTVIFLNLPAGLVLYFFVSNLLSIAQQLYINRVVKD
jgi:YidC/Oxa1 family membrane protein insertase